MSDYTDAKAYVALRAMGYSHYVADALCQRLDGALEAVQHLSPMEVAEEVAAWHLGDGSWAGLLVGAHKNAEEVAHRRAAARRRR